jgi:16S rRNA (uracil1498-N3)-methyltransferase
MQQYYAKDKKNNILYLNHDDLNHIKNVMRMEKDDKIICVYDNSSYICSLNEDLLSCNIIEVFKNDEKLIPIVCYVPLLSEEKMSFILQHGTELGITKFIVVEYEHCKYKLPKKDYEKKLTRWGKIIKEATEQSYRIDKPELEGIISYKDIESIANVNILCSLDKDDVKNICQVLTMKNANDTISLVFGPEGGLSKKEEEILVEKGFIKTSLGKDVLRTETVPLMIASILKYLRESD